MTQTLDVKGLNCPMPIMKVKKTLKGLPAGEHLEVLVTDPGAVRDFQTFSKSSGNPLLEMDENDGVYRFVFEKG